MRLDSFDSFCAEILERHDWPGNISADKLASLFVRHFSLPDFPRFEDLDVLIRDTGVGTIVKTALPTGLRGAHFETLAGHYVIHYSEDDWERAREHTVLHEVYEILQGKFKSLESSYRPPKRPRICRHADRFAAAVLIQPEMFRLFAEQSGFDVISLQKMYGRSYASVALRISEVTTDQPVLVAVYSRHDLDQPDEWEEPPSEGDFAATLVATTQPFKLAGVAPRRYPFVFPSGRIPKKGQVPAPDTAVANVIASGRSVSADRVSGYRNHPESDATVLARPVKWHGRLARVVLVATPWTLRGALTPQLANANPIRIDSADSI